MSMLPERPSLELERKRVKRLLKSARGGDDKSLGRIRVWFPQATAADATLAQAQLAVAREYGFTSWPRLVAYFVTWERHDREGGRESSEGPDWWEWKAQRLLDPRARTHPVHLRAFAAFVPRLYAALDEEIAATTITDEEARLVVARLERFSSWDALIEAARHRPPGEYEPDESKRAALHRARVVAAYGEAYADALAAIRAHDATALARVLDADPSLARLASTSGTPDALLHVAIDEELSERSAASRAVTSLLIAGGAQPAPVATRRLFRAFVGDAEAVHTLLAYGAEAAARSPSGLSLLEWALLRWWNGAAVDALVPHAPRPRDAFWIRAGLGDVHGTLRYLDARGRPNAAARRDRLDLTLVGLHSATRPEAEDREIVWEAFFVAGLNARFDVLDALLARGFPIDYAPWGHTLRAFAEGNSHTLSATAAFLASRGAR